MIVEETNSYAATNVVTSPHSRPWYNVTIEEMKAFVGMLIVMGVLKLPRLDLYWSNKYPHVITPGISNIMARVRFEQIYRFLHLNDNLKYIPFGQPRHDHLFKVRKLFDLILPKFETEYKGPSALHYRKRLRSYTKRFGESTPKTVSRLVTEVDSNLNCPSSRLDWGTKRLQ